MFDNLRNLHFKTHEFYLEAKSERWKIKNGQCCQFTASFILDWSIIINTALWHLEEGKPVGYLFSFKVRFPGVKYRNSTFVFKWDCGSVT